MSKITDDELKAIRERANQTVTFYKQTLSFSTGRAVSIAQDALRLLDAVDELCRGLDDCTESNQRLSKQSTHDVFQYSKELGRRVELERELAQCQQERDRLIKREKTIIEHHTRRNRILGRIAKRFRESAGRAEQERDRLLAVVQAVEWVFDPETPDYYDDPAEYLCPWCVSNKLVGHKPDCQRQQALAGAGREESET